MTEQSQLRVAFVTGGSGFIGHHLIAALKQRGMEVRALARSASAAEVIQRAGAMPVEGDLDDEQALCEGMNGCDVVYHLAAKGAEWGTYEDFYRINVAGTEHIIAAARAASVARLIYVSTEAVLAGDGPIINADETRPRSTRPPGFYSLTKGLAEERVLTANSPALATIIVRPRAVWGEGTPLLSQLAKSVRTGSFKWIDGGHYLTSTCHVVNVCEGMLLAAEHGQGGEVYFLTDGAPIEFRSLAIAFLQTQGVTPGDSSIPGWMARLIAWWSEWAWHTFHLKGAPPITRELVRLGGEEVTINDAKARRELGYKGSVSREEGLARIKLQVLPTVE